jgi:hypothetical protein
MNLLVWKWGVGMKNRLESAKMRHNGLRSMVAAAILLAAVGFPRAEAATTTLSGFLTADNEFDAYISTSDAILGTLISSGNNWPTASSLSVVLTSGVTNYLHIVASNFDGPGTADNPDAFLGQFLLSNANFKFANGTQTLVTNTIDWRASPAAILWFAPSGTPVSFGLNGGPDIWTSANGGNPISNIGTNAEWIWSNPDPTGQAFLSTTISAVPEAATWAMMLFGFAVVGFMAYRRTKRAVLAAA